MIIPGWLEFILALTVTLLAVHALIVLFNFSMAMIASAGGITIERISIGFGKRLFGLTYRGTPVDVCLFPGGYTKFKGQGEEADGPDAPDSWPAASVPLRLAIVIGGPASTIVLGLLLLALPVAFGSGQLVKTTKENGEIWPCAVEGLAIRPNSSTLEGQFVFFQETAVTYLVRLFTFRSLHGWGGLIGCFATIAAVGQHSATAWLTCIGTIAVANGMVNLLPVPCLNGGHAVSFIWEGLTGRTIRSETATTAGCAGAILLVTFALRMLYLDAMWLWSLLG